MEGVVLRLAPPIVVVPEELTHLKSAINRKYGREPSPHVACPM